MPKSVAYVIKAFPEPSETFIAEEAASLITADVLPCMLHLQDASSSILHPSAQALIANGLRFRMKQTKTPSFILYLALWSLIAPRRTFRILCKAWQHSSRWCYFQALAPSWWCRQHKVDFLHAHFADVNFQYAAAMSDWSGIPFGVTTHRYDILEDPLGIEIANDLYRMASVVVTISEFNRRFMMRKYELPESRITVVHCGIDLDRFAFQPRIKRQKSEPLRLLNVGRLVHVKGQDILLRALAVVRSRGIRFHLDIVGAGDLLQDLLTLAKKLKIDDCVIFHGAKPEQFVRGLHLRAHVFVLPSRSEGLPVVCIEALAMGTPTIATRINGIPELIEDGKTGLLIEPEDVNGLADSICLLEADQQLAQKLQFNGREAVVAGFDRKKCTQQLIALWAKHDRYGSDVTCHQN